MLIDREHSSNVLFIVRELAELENDAQYSSLPKLKELIKKFSNLTWTGKKKPHCPISHSLTCFVEFIGRPCFYFAEGLAGLTDGLAIGGAESRVWEVAIGFSGWSLWNVEIIFRRCMTVEDGSQVLFSCGWFFSKMK